MLTRIALLLVALAIGGFASAAENATPSGSARTGDAATLTGAAAAERLRALLGGKPTIEGRFAQSVVDAKGVLVQRSSGRFVAQQPRRLRWQVQAPASQLLVTDGTQVWLYDPDLEQVTVDVLDAVTADAPMLVLSGQVDRLLDRYTLAATRSGAEWRFDLRVRANGNVARQSFRAITLRVRDGELRSMHVEDALGQRTELVFSEVRHPSRVDGAQFRFSIPPGTEVIRRAS